MLIIDITKSSFFKYFFFASLYFIQGIILTMAWVLLPIYFIEKNIPLPLATLAIGVAMIPWSIKFMFGVIVDYFNQFGRKIFIILGGILFASGLFFATFIDPGVYLLLFVFILFMSVFGVVLLDVAVDALAIETSQENERGKISGAMFAGQRIGMLVSSLLLTFIAQTIGFTFAFLISGIIIIIVTFFTIFFKEIKIYKKAEKISTLLIREFKKKMTQLISFFSFMLYISIGLILIVVPLYMKYNLHLDIAQIGLIVAIFPVTTAVGSLIGGLLCDKLGRKIALSIFISGSIIFSILLIFANRWHILLFLYGIIGFLYGGYLAVNFAMLMDITNPRVGATQFSVLTSLSNAGNLSGNTLSGSMVSLFGFGRVFLFSAWFLGPALLLLYFIRLKNHIKTI